MGELERRHVHQISMHVCYAPKGVSPDLLFGRYVGHSGEECYVLDNPQNRMPTQYCQEVR